MNILSSLLGGIASTGTSLAILLYAITWMQTLRNDASKSNSVRQLATVTLIVAAIAALAVLAGFIIGVVGLYATPQA